MKKYTTFVMIVKKKRCELISFCASNDIVPTVIRMTVPTVIYLVVLIR